MGNILSFHLSFPSVREEAVENRRTKQNYNILVLASVSHFICLLTFKFEFALRVQQECEIVWHVQATGKRLESLTFRLTCEIWLFSLLYFCFCFSPIASPKCTFSLFLALSCVPASLSLRNTVCNQWLQTANTNNSRIHIEQMVQH